MLAPGVPSLGMRKPYLSVVTLTGVQVTASDVASAEHGAMSGQTNRHCQQGPAFVTNIGSLT